MASGSSLQGLRSFWSCSFSTFSIRYRVFYNTLLDWWGRKWPLSHSMAPNQLCFSRKPSEDSYGHLRNSLVGLLFSIQNCNTRVPQKVAISSYSKDGKPAPYARSLSLVFGACGYWAECNQWCVTMSNTSLTWYLVSSSLISVWHEQRVRTIISCRSCTSESTLEGQ